MPKVAIDLRMVRGRLHGIARYALELACRLPPLEPGWSWVGLTGPEGLPAGLGALTPELDLLRCAVPFLSPLEQPTLAATLVGAGIDLFHATSFSLPALWPGRLVATLHDANHLALPQDYGWAQRAYYRLIVGPRAHSARALITVSEFSRAELARLIDLNPYRLQVIPQGVAPHFRPAASSEVDPLARRLGLPRPFFLAVANTKPYKNLGLLAALAPLLPAPLVLLAGPGAARAVHFPGSTVALDEVSEQDLPVLYSAATALLLPSRYEGFGLPVLEAMASGCPVVAARAGALPEVVGEAGDLVGPDDLEGWRAAAARLLRDADHRQQRVEAGLERAAHWTWEDCARRTLAVYHRAL